MWQQPITNQGIYCYRLLYIVGQLIPNIPQYTDTVRTCGLCGCTALVSSDATIKSPKSSKPWKDKLKQTPERAQRGLVRQQSLISEML